MSERFQVVPASWATAAAGHVEAGESAVQAAVLERLRSGVPPIVAFGFEYA
ncbi:hypothetical protein LJ754_09825 [Arthrobacter sp. zg-Y40]|uniref:hypothetical protein n=1 Tax=Arthrobacter sp. zg-Y40 TaxID=2886939 RepID=UPI001D13E5D9|nr:hypothetical protein [Arthrobacter sp. zg-Y40]MCC3279452.1 hypothetical protein [Arthrobacter sp. zg-Y40]